MEDVDFVKCIPIFKSIDGIELLFSQGQMKIKEYAKGETLYNQGCLCNSLDIVVYGSLTAYSLTENGSSTIMFEFKKDSIIGANLLFATNNVYPLNIYCSSECRIIHIEKTAVEILLHNYDFVMSYIKSLSQNSLGLNQKIAMFSRKTLRQNIFEYLFQQSIVQCSATVYLPFTKKEFADYLGVQRPSLFRELKKCSLTVLSALITEK
ncbi:cAMP-binding domain of CRP or a regulatory subunit of cAMP-dependent protein kinases [Hathewaya proteolytica DSM 3090]|uniref:cAMP-binding domain of CRP or a regulatory subunit of cAMP-dependent protein kinases n=1 Tax=Hathewaya proteolytica DSM 3090 TaxID=1121331 RepID=A0A1M6SWY7_9CLOT|nr:Crp/Fnr family transcriptional regulator [Hathewaya proteolytica]SHK49196.1 cAMP-binding domain of CRP or a regulatory subunit of cAMP-dependent protein kinases [Hathewaya proteolytica DSM 3090]